MSALTKARPHASFARGCDFVRTTSWCGDNTEIRLGIVGSGMSYIPYHMPLTSTTESLSDSVIGLCRHIWLGKFGNHVFSGFGRA